MTSTSMTREAEKDMRDGRRRFGIGRGAAVALAASLIALAGCEVTNPGPVADENLDQPTVHQAIINGAGRKMSQATSFVGYTGALAAREILAGGQTGNGGHDAITQAGQLLPTNNNNPWGYVHTARWIA